MSWAVLKFGGSSVSTRARWDTIAGIVGGHRAAERRVLVVVSALSGVTDLLTRLLPAALRGEHGGLLDTIVSRHSALLSDLDSIPASSTARLTPSAASPPPSTSRGRPRSA